MAFQCLEEETIIRILQLHSNFIVFKPIAKEIAIAEEVEKEEKRVDNTLVLFVAVEKGDTVAVAQKAIDDAYIFIKKLKINSLVIYPYAHLSSNLEKPTEAGDILEKMGIYAKQTGIETLKAPFGWNKQFTISIKGHPLAEQARVYTPTSSGTAAKTAKDSRISKALKNEEKLVSLWHVLQIDGELVPVGKFSFKGHDNLNKFAKYEIKKVRASQQMPPHVPLMKRLEIADYEGGSDPGNLRWYPKGRLVKSLLEQLVTSTMVAYGAMEVETPIMYDFNHPSLADYLNRFPARQYLLKTEDKELFLRFAACFGQFLMVHDTQISYKHMPLKLYELSRYSFRREKSGEVVGLKRLRAFTMPDCHAFCTDLEQAREEFLIRFRLCLEVLSDIGLSKNDYEVALRLTKDFYEDNKPFVAKIAKIYGKPILVEMWEERFFYFTLKWDINFVDNQNKAAALSTDQIDVENAKRYDIAYIDEKGEKQYPLILHCSPSGAIERCVYALLEKAHKEKQSGALPMLPLWLSPVQARLIPMSEKYMKKVEETARHIQANSIRVDIDDRSFTLQKRIREAEKEWVPYVIVVGQKEIESGILSVRIRTAHGEVKKIQLSELIARIKSELKDKPFKPLPLPQKLSRRPQFYG